MTQDTDNDNDNDNDSIQPAPPEQDFNATPWQVLVGIMVTSDPRHPGDMTAGLLVGMAATAEVMEQGPQGPRPDKTNEAVHFAQWLDRNKEHLAALWRTEYVQYMNLRRMSERGIPGLRIAGADEQPGILGADGKALQ